MYDHSTMGKISVSKSTMGIKNSVDIFQAVMMDLLGNLEYANTYLDDVLITSKGSFEEHLAKVNTVLDRLEKAGF